MTLFKDMISIYHFKKGLYIRSQILFILMIFMSGAAIVAQNVDNTKLEQVTLHLKWMHAFQFAGYYAAGEQGYYLEEGLEVKINAATHDFQAFNTVLAGNAEYGVWGSELLIERINGKPFVVLASIFQHSPYVILTRKDRNIRVPSDLIGCTVMTESGQGSSQLRAMLLHEGIEPDQINFIPSSWKINDLLNGSIDASMDYITDQPNQMLMHGVDPFVIKPIDYGIDFYGDCLFTTEDEINQNPERVEAFKRASLKGWEYAMENVDELVEYILTLPNVKERGLTAEHLRYEAEQMQTLILPKLVEIGNINPGRWKHIADTYVSLGLIDPDYSLKGFIYEPLLPVNNRLFYILLLAFVGIVFVAFFGWVANRKLRNVIDRRTSDLRLSESKLIETQKIALIGRWEFDMQNNKTVLMDEVLELFNLNANNYNITFTSILEFLLPEDIEWVTQEFNKAIKAKTNIQFETKFVLPDSNYKWINVIGKCEYDKIGQLTRAFGTVRDITERKLIELELRKHRENLEELVKERTIDIEDKNAELFRLNKLFIGREFRIKELRDKVKELEKKK